MTEERPRPESTPRLCRAWRAARLPVTLLLVSSLAASVVSAVPETPRGRLVPGPDHRSKGELVRLPDEILPALVALPVDGAIRIPGWPIAPGMRSDVRLVRRDVYAADAKMYRVDKTGPVEIPRSRLLFFIGFAEEDESHSVVVTIDPDAGTLEARSIGPDGRNLLRAPGDFHPADWFIASEKSFDDALPFPLERSCGTETLEELPPVATALAAPDPTPPLPTSAPIVPEPEAIQWLHSVTVAVDTDNELLLQKFSDNTTNAANYVAQLFAALTPDYERDLKIRLLQGTTYYRVSSTPDPYVQDSGGGASSAELQEFGNYWIANYSGVTRGLAMMLSGKSINVWSSSGIAWVSPVGLCNLSYGYSFTKVFKYPGSTGTSDALVIGHESGHNYGSNHTHCYLTPTPIDTCYSGQSGCYSGATSCPAAETINGVPNVKGTWMSYCHMLGGGCTSSEVFHPRTVAVIAPNIQSRVGNGTGSTCVVPLGAVQEASPASQLRVAKGSGTTLALTMLPACGASRHTVYRGTLSTLRTSGVSWTTRHCNFDNSGALSFDPSTATDLYFVVVGNNGTQEGSYGKDGSGAELPAAGAGTCTYTRVLGGTCP